MFFPVSNCISKNNQKSRRWRHSGGSSTLHAWLSVKQEERLWLCCEGVQGKDTLLALNLLVRGCACADRVLSSSSWLKGKAHVCVRLIKLLILLQVCLHGSVLFHVEVQPLWALCSPGFCPCFKLPWERAVCFF